MSKARLYRIDWRLTEEIGHFWSFARAWRPARRYRTRKSRDMALAQLCRQGRRGSEYRAVGE